MHWRAYWRRRVLRSPRRLRHPPGGPVVLERVLIRLRRVPRSCRRAGRVHCPGNCTSPRALPGSCATRAIRPAMPNKSKRSGSGGYADMTDDLKNTTTTDAVAEDWAKVKLPPRLTGLPMAVLARQRRRRRKGVPASPSVSAFIRCDTASPPISWSRRPIFGSSRFYWDIRSSTRRRSTPASPSARSAR